MRIEAIETLSRKMSKPTIWKQRAGSSVSENTASDFSGACIEYGFNTSSWDRGDPTDLCYLRHGFEIVGFDIFMDKVSNSLILNRHLH